MPRWQDRLEDARKFWEIAQSADRPGYANQAASNAVLAAIAANDAVCLVLTGTTSGGESHTRAAAALREACRGKPCEREAAEKSRQLLDILREKSAVQYHGRPLSAGSATKVMRQTERFVEWAEGVVRASAGDAGAGA
jgi:hypothetical protein